MIIAGIDEAGYGPLLGPLVVSCAALEVPWPADAPLPMTVDELPCAWRLLKAGVVKKNTASARGRVLIADSKIVHNLTAGVKLLERGVLSFLAAAQLHAATESSRIPATLSDLIDLLDCRDHGLSDHPWYGDAASALPLWADPGDLAIATNLLRNAMTAAAVRLCALRTVVLPEQPYNRMVTATNNKGSALVSITLRHVHWLHNTLGHLGLVIGIDKQGGRDHYTQLLLQTFPEATLRILQEDEHGSSYLVVENGAPARRTVLHFREKGETHFLPTALSSMVCKYLRESCMERFNTWWCQQVPGLRPTAGYYQDGMRWIGDAEPHFSRLGVTRAQLVRIR